MQDEDVRASCFSQLAVLQAQFGEDVPYRDGLDRGFTFRSSRVPYLNYQKGIYRAAVQRGRACLSINTSVRSPYEDEQTPDGFLYDYRAGDVDQPDNRALRAAHELRVPIVYFVGTRPGWYRPLYPTYVLQDAASRVASSSRRELGPGQWTSANPLTSTIPSSAATPSATCGHDSIRPASAAVCCLRTGTAARSVDYERSDSSTRRTSRPTPTSRARHRSRTA